MTMLALKKKRDCLLLVEDHEDTAFFLTHWLRRRGYRAVHACTTEEAMQLLRDLIFIEARLHRVLVDYRLPDATGCRVVQAFQEDAPETGVAMMTAHHDLALEIWVRARGVPIFRKPLEMARLARWLASPDPIGAREA